MTQLRASVIGLRRHAGLHIKLLDENPDVTLDQVLYHQLPPAEYSHLPISNHITDCMNSDLIIVSTPTSTHFDYMQALADFPGYIFLEKPAVNSKEQIEQLLELPTDLKSRTRVNFNLAFHQVTLLLSKLINAGKLGTVFSFDVHSSHGVAFKSGWQNSWRITDKSGFGPIETTGIHYVQLSLQMFGKCQSSYLDTHCLSGVPNAVDTGTLDMNMEDDVRVRIRHSYAAPYGVRMEAWGTDGYFLYDGEVANVYYPRDTFDSDGLFSKPPLQDSWNIAFKQAWDESLCLAQREFVNVVKDAKRLNPEVFDRDVAAMNVLLEAKRISEKASPPTN